MPFIDTAFEQRRAKLLGGGSAPKVSSNTGSKTISSSVPTSTIKVTNNNNTKIISDPVFEQRRAQLLKQGPKMIATPAPAAQPKAPTISPLDQAKQALNTGGKIIKDITDAVKFTFVKPKIISPLPEDKPKQTISQGPITLHPDQKKLDVNQLQQAKGVVPQVQPHHSALDSIVSAFSQHFPQTKHVIDELKQDPYSLKGDPRQGILKAWDTVKGSFLESFKRSVKADEPNLPLQERVVRKVEQVSGAANAVLSPVSALFELGNSTPVLGTFTRLLSLPFTAIGEGAPQISNKMIDDLPIPDKTKARIKPVVAEVFTLAAQVALGKLSDVAGEKVKGTIGKIGSDGFEQLTKNMIHDSGSPKTINLTPKEIHDVNLGRGGAYETDLVKSLGLTGDQWRDAIKKGISIDVPAEKVTRIIDKPYWEKVKSIFGQAATNREVRDGITPSTRTGFAGYLTPGETTPQEVINKVISTGAENTPEGKAALQAAVEAQRGGHNINVEINGEGALTPEAQKATDLIAKYREANQGKLLNVDDVREMYSPEGYNRINSAEFQDKASGLADQIFKEDVASLRPGDKYLFTAGSSGAGKTSGLARYPNITQDVKAGLDGNFSSARSLDKLDQVLKTGADTGITFVYRDPIEAWNNGVIKRVKNPDNGRVVPIGVFLDNLENSVKRVLEAYDKYGDQLNVNVINNSAEAGGAKLVENPIDFLRKIKYNIDDVRQQITTYTRDQINSGEINADAGRALLQESVPKNGGQSERGNAKQVTSLEQAKKYKTEKDFINAHRQIFRGDNTEEVRLNNAGETSFSAERSVAEEYAKKYGNNGKVNERYLKSDAKILDVNGLSDAIKADIKEGYGSLSDENITDYAYDNNYDAIDFSTGERKGTRAEAEVKILNVDALKTKQDLTDIYNKSRPTENTQVSPQNQPEKAAVSTDTPGSELSAEKAPVGEGKVRESEAYKKVRDRLDATTQEDVNYNRLNLKQDAENALEFIAKEPEKALRVAFGLEAAPAGQTETAISIALADKAGRDGNYKLQSQLESSRSLRQTRRGQEIVSERGRFNDDSPYAYISDLLDRRLTSIGKNLKTDVVDQFNKISSAKKRAVEIIDEKVKQLSDRLKKRDKTKIKMAQDIIDNLICK